MRCCRRPLTASGTDLGAPDKLHRLRFCVELIRFAGTGVEANGELPREGLKSLRYLFFAGRLSLLFRDLFLYDLIHDR